MGPNPHCSSNGKNFNLITFIVNTIFRSRNIKFCVFSNIVLGYADSHGNDVYNNDVYSNDVYEIYCDTPIR